MGNEQTIVRRSARIFRFFGRLTVGLGFVAAVRCIVLVMKDVIIWLKDYQAQMHAMAATLNTIAGDVSRLQNMEEHLGAISRDQSRLADAVSTLAGALDQSAEVTVVSDVPTRPAEPRKLVLAVNDRVNHWGGPLGHTFIDRFDCSGTEVADIGIEHSSAWLGSGVTVVDKTLPCIEVRSWANPFCRVEYTIQIWVTE